MQTSESHAAAKEAHLKAAQAATNESAKKFHEHMAAHHQQMNDMASQHAEKMKSLLADRERQLAPLKSEKEKLVGQIKGTNARSKAMLRQQRREEN